MPHIEQANEAEIVERNNLAKRVAEALKMAGFNTIAQDSDRRPDTGGALISVDPMTDSRGGVFVRWEVHTSFSRAVAGKLQKGELQDPTFRHFSFITEHMHTTMIAILESAGFRASDAEDDMSPYMIRVEDVPSLDPPRES
ncbi:hypothetical protein GCM10010415_56600 [Streptomyces atrovirens]|uniref:Uncharacterized protein n=1 Tax=Streptomyces atrovirens TaxID=285556 RepID=A0ABW0DUS7_9ACTN